MANLTELERARLRWRARRGLLENDLIITAFLDRYEDELTDADVSSLTHLFEMDDNTLLEVLLGKSEPAGDYDTANIHRLVKLMRNA
ncbi:succinate dehydrogenase assembly factor 2 [Pelistega europaea]|uniref:FAD assembly factor SdhE n=1 Tax=Pelistega europaea TaxID=106147 RepID=A0A7Y4P4E1_9BURK|nr:succinate dehydrogenase assembly factor 2 [Pelistega europaea]NOL49411.1 succinate dehydrogenase assembly factor 2 [Pelistega europaea]